MHFGIRKTLFELHALVVAWNFGFRKYLFGFEAANLTLSKADKASVLLILKRYGAQIGVNSDIETGLTFHNCRDYSHLIVGNNCHIGKNAFFDLRDKVEIGDNVVISMGCMLLTHIDLNGSALSKAYPAEKGLIKIEHDCYVGARCTILKGIHVGPKSFIAAGSLVNKDVETSTMVGGVPAKMIKRLAS